MADDFQTPTQADLIRRAEDDLVAGGLIATLRRSVEAVLARVVAGLAYGCYRYLAWISRQVWPWSMTAFVLERQASWWGVNRKEATAGSGPVTISGMSGTLIPAGTILRRADGGEYTVQADQIIAGGVATVTVVAAIAGFAGNAQATVALTFRTPVAGATSALVAAGGLIGGADRESDNALRDRWQERVAAPPAGGADWDYVRWAKEVAGVTRAWVLRYAQGEGTVSVFFATDDDPGGLIPNAGKVAQVQSYIDARRPTCARITVIAPTPKPVAYQITITPNNPAVQAAVEAELRDLHRREAVLGKPLLISRIRATVSGAAGETDNVVVAPAANVSALSYEIPTFGSVTFV